jgi:hypothetical protein
VSFAVYRTKVSLADTEYGRLLAAGAPTVPLYFVLPSGRIQQLNGVLNPDPRFTELFGGPCYYTERCPYHSYGLGVYTGNLTPGDALADAIGRTAADLDAARTRVAKLEAALERYNAAAEALGG